jgi:hypothetical protein
MTTTIHASGARDLIALTPAMVGLIPEDRLVVHLLKGKRLALTVTVDLEAALAPGPGSTKVRDAINSRLPSGTYDAALAHLWTGKDLDAAQIERLTAQLPRLAERPVLVTPTGFTPIPGTMGTRGLPRQPLPPFKDQDLTRDADPTARPAPHLRPQHGAVPEPFARASAQRIHRAIAKETATRTAQAEGDFTAVFTADAAALDRLITTGPSDGIPSPDHVRLVSALAADRQFRDYTLVRLATTNPNQTAELIGTFTTGSFPEREEHMTGALFSTRSPSDLADPAQLASGISHLELISRMAPEGQRANPMATIAVLSWWQTRPGPARAWADAALADQPDNRLAQLVHQCLEHEIPPRWTPTPERSPAKNPAPNSPVLPRNQGSPPLSL